METGLAVDEKVRDLERRVRMLEDEVSMLKRKQQNRDVCEALVEALLRAKRFGSKTLWIRRADVARDSFYRHEDEVIKELQRRGYRVVYEEVLKGKKKQIVVKLERL